MSDVEEDTFERDSIDVARFSELEDPFMLCDIFRKIKLYHLFHYARDRFCQKNTTWPNDYWKYHFYRQVWSSLLHVK